MTRQVTGALLLGGRSQRMGQDKANLRHGRTLLRSELGARLSAAFGRPALLVARPGQALEEREFVVVQDLHPGKGAMGGLHSALVHADTPWVGLFACDMPELSVPLLRAMAEVPDGEEDILMPRTAEGWQPLHALYHRRCLPALEQALQEGRLGLRRWAATREVRELGAPWCARFDPLGRSFTNLNTPAELQAWREARSD